MTTPPNLSSAALQQGFLTILPRVEQHALVFFRHLKCPHRKADAIQETVAIAFKWYVRATEQGKDVSSFVAPLATFAARHVRAGRRLCGQDGGRDVLSPLVQARHGFAVGSLPQKSTLNGNVFDQALQDNTRSPVPEQAAFRIDFPAWLSKLGERNRRLARDMALGHHTQDLAAMHGVSQGRVSQLRRHFREDWRAFCSGPGEEGFCGHSV